MKKVITYGTFDLFHEGHYKLLERARALGDYLIVGVTTEHFDEIRGKVNVIDPILERIDNVRQTGFADEIIIEDHEGQKIEDIQRYGVDTFTVGSDWVGTFDYLKVFCNVVYLDRKASDYVYYWTDMFDEAGVEVPETWDEFVEASEKLQEHFGPQAPDFGAICMGAKDAWPTYPLMEYGPAAQSGNGYYWDAMTTEDAPFAEGTDIHTVYGKIYDLFQKGVLGKDPLGITYDQSRALFAKKKGAMTLNSPMFLTAYKADGYDTAGMSTFYLPFRDSSQDEFNLVTQGDCFLTVTNNSENPEVAKAFLEFYFSEAWYPDYIADSTMTPYAKELDPVLQTASELQPEVKFVTYGAGGSDFINMVSETKFDCKQLGVEMLTDGFDYAKRCEELNQTWAEARTKLGLK